jgi:hypothetical protein
MLNDDRFAWFAGDGKHLKFFLTQLLTIGSKSFLSGLRRWAKYMLSEVPK